MTCVGRWGYEKCEPSSKHKACKSKKKIKSLQTLKNLMELSRYEPFWRLKSRICPFVLTISFTCVRYQAFIASWNCFRKAHNNQLPTNNWSKYLLFPQTLKVWSVRIEFVFHLTTNDLLKNGPGKSISSFCSFPDKIKSEKAIFLKVKKKRVKWVMLR